MRLLASILLTLSFPAYSQILINEYSCSNISTLADSEGDFVDWIEFVNTGASTINLENFSLSNDWSTTKKTIFPSINLAPGQFLVVFASGKNKVIGNTEIHTLFDLDQTKGDPIILRNPSGAIEDTLNIRLVTKPNHSIGRPSFGSINWKLYTGPTPGQANGSGGSYYTPPPRISIPAGRYSASQLVTLSCLDPNAIIRYTLDGSDVNSLSPLYLAPIPILATTVLKAACFSSAPTSFMETNTYILNVDHSLPILSVTGNNLVGLLVNGVIPIGNNIGNVEFIETDGKLKAESTGFFTPNGNNDSWILPQKGFNFSAKDELGVDYALEHRLFQKITKNTFRDIEIIAGGNDNFPSASGTHLRDVFAHTMALKADLDLDVSVFRACVVYLNGLYWGVYQIKQPVSSIDYLRNTAPLSISDVNYVQATNGQSLPTFGGSSTLDRWTDLIDYVNNNDMGDPASFRQVDSLFNWKSLVDYFVFNSYMVSKDWLTNNTNWWTAQNQDGTIVPWRYALGSMDAILGQYVNTAGIPDTSPQAPPCGVDNLANPGNAGHSILLTKLINENEEVKTYYITRYLTLKNSTFSCANMIATLDSLENTLSPEMNLHCLKWGSLPGTWQQSVQELRDFLQQRCNYIDQGIKDCYNLVGPFALQVDVVPPKSGEVFINSNNPPSYPWIYDQFGGLTTYLVAVADSGFVFEKWELSSLNFLDSLEENALNSVHLIGGETLVARFRELPQDPSKPPVNKEGGFALPNAFSPNGDGNNDLFRALVGENVQNFELAVYDRWGIEVFRTNNRDIYWDGTYNGQPSAPGVYVYSAEIKYYDLTSEKISGNLTLLR